MDEFDEFLRSCSQDRTIADVVNDMTEQQKRVLYYMVGSAIEEERKTFERRVRTLLEYYR